MDDSANSGDQAAAPDRVKINAPPQDFTDETDQPDDEPVSQEPNEETQSVASTPTTTATTTSTSTSTSTTTRTATASTTETPSSSIATEEETSSTLSDSETETRSITATSTVSAETTSTVLPSSSSVETSEIISTESTPSSEIIVSTSEISTSSEVITKSRPPPKPTKLSPSPSPSKALSRGDDKDDGLGTGTTIGIVLAAFVGAGVLIIVIGALLRWRRRRRIAKKSEGLPAFKTILDFADPGGSTNSIDAANEKAAKDLSTIPVTPPYRPEKRQAQKRNSWFDEQQASDRFETCQSGPQRADSQRSWSRFPIADTDPAHYDNTVHRAQTIDDRYAGHSMVTYGSQNDHGIARLPLQLRPGGHGDQHVGGAFDPVRGQHGYNDYYHENGRDPPPVRNRHFPAAPGRAYTLDNPYPFVPTGQR